MSNLPEKWCVQRNSKNYKEINNWYNKLVGREGATLKENTYFTYNSKKGGYGRNRNEGCIEITFEQFKEWILNKEKVDDFLIFN